MDSISSPDFWQKIEKKHKMLVLDVRSKEEAAAVKSPGNAMLLPLTELMQRVSELNSHKNHEIVVVCLSGSRSAMAVNYLKQQDFSNVKTLSGGLLKLFEFLHDSKKMSDKEFQDKMNAFEL